MDLRVRPRKMGRTRRSILQVILLQALTSSATRIPHVDKALACGLDTSRIGMIAFQ